MDASVAPAGVIRMAASASTIAMKMPRHHLSRPARNRRPALIRSPQPINIDSLRLRFRICSRILFSYSQVSLRKLDFLPSSASRPPLPQADGLRDGLAVYVTEFSRKPTVRRKWYRSWVVGYFGIGRPKL